MENQLDPVIQEKLVAFRRRWRRLILLRGLSYTLLTVIGGLLILALVDWNFPLEPAETRSWCSIGILAAAFLVFLLGCVRPLFRVPDLTGLAALMEKAEPGLRNDLLAAVELGDIQGGADLDSPVFREMLQKDVATRAQKIEISQSLPLRLVRRWIVVGLLLLLSVVIVAIIPSGFNQLKRVAAPWLNLGTAGAKYIIILQPADPENAFAPRHERFLVEIEILDSGLLAEMNRTRKNPTFEIDNGQGDTEIISMIGAPAGNGTRFSSSANMTDPELQFRFLAGQHTTKWYTMRAMEPPQVVRYIKTITPPAYPLFPGFKPDAEVMEGEEGKISARAGSTIDIQAVINQPVVEARLQLTVSGNATDHPMTARDGNEPNGYSASFQVQTNSAYQVFVRDANGLTNRAPRKFNINLRPDLPPEILSHWPKGDLILGPEDLLGMNATARDDVAIGEIRRLTRVIARDANATNDANATWTATVLTLDNLPGNNATFDQPLDLLPLNVKPGDQVLTRLVAVDVAGQVTATPLVTLHIRSSVFEIARGEALPPKRALLEAVRELRKTIGDLRAVIPLDLEKPARDGALGDLQKASDDADNITPKVSGKIAQANVVLLTALARARRGREAAELVTFGRAINLLGRDNLPALRLHLPKMSGEAEAVRVERAKAAEAAIRPMEPLADKLESAVRQQLAADTAAVMLDHLEYLARAQRLMNRAAEADAGTDPGAWKRLARRQVGALKELVTVGKLIADSTGHLEPAVANDLNATQTRLETAAATMKQALENGAPGPALLPPAKALFQAIQEAVDDRLRPLARDKADDAALERGDLEQLVGDSRDPLPPLNTALTALDLARADQRDKTGNALREALARTRLAEDRAEHQWDAIIELLDARATLEGTRPDSDFGFVRDLVNASRTMKNLKRSPKFAADLKPVLNRKADAIHTREQGHLLNDLLKGITRLSSDELINTAATDIRTLRVRDAEWLMELFRRLPRKLRTAKLQAATAEVIEQAGLSEDARAVAREMNRRKTEKGEFGVED